jgi:ElaA protein
MNTAFQKRNLTETQTLQGKQENTRMSKIKNIIADPSQPSSSKFITWVFSNFEELNVHQLYKLLALRESIFIVEQNVPYVDMDGKDMHCIHLMGYYQTALVAYMRVVPIDLFEAGYFSFGRVVVRADMRNRGAGRQLVRSGIEFLDTIREGFPIKISSQLYLEDFYASFGFVTQGESYIEDQIPHIAMVRA